MECTKILKRLSYFWLGTLIPIQSYKNFCSSFNIGGVYLNLKLWRLKTQHPAFIWNRHLFIWDPMPVNDKLRNHRIFIYIKYKAINKNTKIDWWLLKSTGTCTPEEMKILILCESQMSVNYPCKRNGLTCQLSTHPNPLEKTVDILK